MKFLKQVADSTGATVHGFGPQGRVGGARRFMGAGQARGAEATVLGRCARAF